MNIRPFRPQDAEQIARLFHETVRQINSRDYTEEQVRAWAPDDIYFRDWEQRCSEKYTLVADENGTIAGFAELEEDGHIDCFYCHKEYLRKGVGSNLYRALERKARHLNISRLFVEASITARPFFAKHGFKLVKKQTVTSRGASFVNFLMEKTI